MFSQPGGAGQPTVGGGETVSRLRGTHGFGAAKSAVGRVIPHTTVDCLSCVCYTRIAKKISIRG